MKRLHKESKNELRRTMAELDDRGARTLKTLKAVLLQCGGSVLITTETMLMMEKTYLFLDISAEPDGLRIAVRKREESDK
jgi:hypothetical protein